MHRKQNDGHVIVHGPENRRRFEPAHSRHGRIENNQIRMQIPSLFNGIHAIRSLAANMEFGLRIEIGMYKLPYDGAVVDNEDTFWHVQTPDRR